MQKSKCLNCGIEFWFRPANKSGKFCSLKCAHISPLWKAAISKSRVGQILPQTFKKGHTRTQKEKHPQWKGDAVKYSGLHMWVESVLGKPMICWSCGDDNRKKYDWANISGLYKRIKDDWMRLCRSCHKNYDISGKQKNEQNHNH